MRGFVLTTLVSLCTQGFSSECLRDLLPVQPQTAPGCGAWPFESMVVTDPAQFLGDANDGGRGAVCSGCVFNGQSQGAGATVLAFLAAVGEGSSCNIKRMHLDSWQNFQGNLCVSCKAESACSLLPSLEGNSAPAFRGQLKGSTLMYMGFSLP